MEKTCRVAGWFCWAALRSLNLVTVVLALGFRGNIRKVTVASLGRILGHGFHFGETMTFPVIKLLNNELCAAPSEAEPRRVGSPGASRRAPCWPLWLQLTCPGAVLSTTREEHHPQLQRQPLPLQSPTCSWRTWFRKLPLPLCGVPQAEDGVTSLRACVPCGLGAPDFRPDPKLPADRPVASLRTAAPQPTLGCTQFPEVVSQFQKE